MPKYDSSFSRGVLCIECISHCVLSLNCLRPSACPCQMHVLALNRMFELMCDETDHHLPADSLIKHLVCMQACQPNNQPQACQLNNQTITGQDNVGPCLNQALWNQAKRPRSGIEKILALVQLIRKGVTIHAKLKYILLTSCGLNQQMFSKARPTDRLCLTLADFPSLAVAIKHC